MTCENILFQYFTDKFRLIEFRPVFGAYFNIYIYSKDYQSYNNGSNIVINWFITGHSLNVLLN